MANLSGKLFFILALSFLALPAESKDESKTEVKAESKIKEKIASKLTEKEEIDEYKDELGFFQKANRDLSDPRFMFHDDKAKMDLGFGGTAKIECGMTVWGSLDSRLFKPLNIEVPTDPSQGFGARIAGSELHFKARATLGKHNIIAFVKLSGTEDNRISLDQAYLSYGGFSLGKIPSFFTDLEYGIKTETMISTQVDRTHILIGYRHRFFNALELGVSVEEPTLDLESYGQTHLGTYYQIVPDIVLRAKYKWQKGHVQLGFLGRTMSYWTSDPEKKVPEYGVDGVEMFKFGYGVSLSGNYCPSDRIKICAAVVGGEGTASYLEGMTGYNLDLYLSTQKSSEGLVMNPLPVMSATLAFQYNWTPKLYSGILGQYMCAFDKQDDAHIISSYKNSLMAAVTLFWNVRDFFYIGGEYIFGFRNNYDVLDDGRTFGQSHRLSIMAAYQF